MPIFASDCTGCTGADDEVACPADHSLTEVLFAVGLTLLVSIKGIVAAFTNAPVASKTNVKERSFFMGRGE